MAQWLTLMPRNREAAGSNLSGFGFSLKGAYYEVGYCGKKTFLAGLQCTLTSSCAKTINYLIQMSKFSIKCFKTFFIGVF